MAGRNSTPGRGSRVSWAAVVAAILGMGAVAFSMFQPDALAASVTLGLAGVTSAILALRDN